MALFHFSVRLFSRSNRNTVQAIAYRAGCKLYDSRTGQSFDYSNKPVQQVELLLPKDAPAWAIAIQKQIAENREKGVQAFVDIMEAAEKRIDSQVYREFEFALHRELTEEQNKALAREFVEDQLCSRGMTTLLNFHFEMDQKTGEYNPHCHVAASTRRLEENGLSSKKALEWDEKSLLFELREQWANYSNFYLKLYGHDVQIDHRSNQERGIEMEPQPKRGRNVLEIERKAREAKTIESNAKGENIENIEKGTLELTASSDSQKSAYPLEDRASDKDTKIAPVTEKMQTFQAAQLRNLYRIMRNPDVILDIVTKHHTTFMWADVQKKLHQYVDNPVLFERLEDKIKASKELVLLRVQKARDSSGVEREKSIYTTRTMLKAERSLIEQAEELGNSKTHGVQGKNIDFAITKANEQLKEYGGLSHDQIKAIHHLVDKGQIKCVVGIAGAGKTTAIGVCHEIWKAEEYAVYGLAPTGKASQNLEGSSLENNGILSTTLHKFLKSFKEGRCQYNNKSILVLDEAGMVDVERFDKLLSATRQLGVKLIVVGDGAQLQPVEAGPAFRLVTEKLGRSELNTVIRQKVEWQKEATVLFGQQKTIEAIKKYEEKGCVHIVEEKLPVLKDAINNKDYDGIVHLYEASHRVSSLIYREMAKDVQRKYPDLKKLYPKIREHEDFQQYLDWKSIEKNAAGYILENPQKCRPALEARNVDTLKLALVFKDNGKDKFAQQEEAKAALKECGLEHLIGQEKKKGQTVDVRQTVKEELIREWHTTFKENPEKSTAILAYSNRDVNDLNRQVRSLLKESGHLSKGEFTFKIKKEIEDDFGRKETFRESKSFSKGDRIVFTKNKYWTGVRNGTMGTITDINNRNIKIKLDEGKEISFAPNLNPYFDHGWAITIHKSQGTTVDQTYVLASFEMTQNLAYVAMTRHREGVKMFGSSLDFWRKEKLPEILSKSGEKLSAADYLDAETLTKIMKRDDQILTKFFQRMSNELEAMGAVTKEAFWNVADHFLGRTREKEIRILEDSVREEVRAEALFKKEDIVIKQENIVIKEGRSPEVQVQVQLQPQPLRRDEEKPIDSNREKAISSPSLKESSLAGSSFNEHPLVKNSVSKKPSGKGFSVESSLIEKTLIENAPNPIKIPEKIIQQQLTAQNPQYKREVVENALKTHMADFADHVFSSIGIDHNRAMSSRIEKRYGVKGGFSVNLQKGVWYSHNDSQMKGGPLQLLTKLKNISYKEAIEYGAFWARISPEQLTLKQQPHDVSPSQKFEKEALEKAKDAKETKQKIERAQSLYTKGQPIQGTLAERYLRDHRKIKGELPQDLLYLPAKGLGKASLPALMAIARSPAGEVTAVQLIFLDPHTANKANIPVPKRSFGALTGAAVTIQTCPPLHLGGEHGESGKSSNLLLIAEGVETALSLKEAGVKEEIKASLGLSNIKNLELKNPNTHVIICGDHDASDSQATKNLEKSAQVLQEKGFKVTVIKPDKLGEDFNDVLKAKGPQEVREILEKRLPKELLASIQPRAEKHLQRDSHVGEVIESRETKQPFKSEKETAVFTVVGKSFQEIVAYCEKRLHDALARDKKPLTKERAQRFPLQAERTATFLVHAYERNGRNPTEEEIAQLSLRAKYEMHRIPEIRQDLIKDWQEKDSFKENDGLRAHMIAERLASIEGRLYLKAKQDGTKVPSNIAHLAHQELKKHKDQTPKLAEELSQKHSLSKVEATNSAKDVLRYKEVHGEHPSEPQIANMAKIAQKLETKYHTSTFNKKFSSLEADYYQRHEGDLLFKHISCQKETEHDIHLPHIQDQAKKSLEMVKLQINQELTKVNQKELSF
ncbi:MAG: AAA family ATPase [Alphaproteobacteria bacterium]|nr:AAA family ATPase [Alphaproteobacteria bacterium]